jgi:hypothetical protein
MRYQHRSRLYSTALCWFALVAGPVAVQTPDLSNQIQRDPTVTGAPYSADQITTVRLTVFGSQIEQQVVARLYRDSAGRIRREQTVGGLEKPGPLDRSDLVVTIVDPTRGVMYTLNPATRTAYRTPIDRTDSAPLRAQEESLGTREIEGLVTIGRRAVVSLPGVGSQPPVEIVDERWDSVDLRVALLALHRDSRSGEFEQRLSNVQRAEPDPNLFTIPSTYTITDVTLPAGK